MPPPSRSPTILPLLRSLPSPSPSFDSIPPGDDWGALRFFGAGEGDEVVVVGVPMETVALLACTNPHPSSCTPTTGAGPPLLLCAGVVACGV